jgi:hypothetical protein
MGIIVDGLYISPSALDRLPFDIVSSDPNDGTNTPFILNTTENVFKVWYNGVWNTLGITITAGSAHQILDDGGNVVKDDDGNIITD